jgi:hypothetical protein
MVLGGQVLQKLNLVRMPFQVFLQDATNRALCQIEAISSSRVMRMVVEVLAQAFNVLFRSNATKLRLILSIDE